MVWGKGLSSSLAYGHSIVPSTICWKDYLFPMYLLCFFCWKSIDHKYKSQIPLFSVALILPMNTGDVVGSEPNNRTVLQRTGVFWASVYFLPCSHLLLGWSLAPLKPMQKTSIQHVSLYLPKEKIWWQNVISKTFLPILD